MAAGTAPRTTRQTTGGVGRFQAFVNEYYGPGSRAYCEILDPQGNWAQLSAGFSETEVMQRHGERTMVTQAWSTQFTNRLAAQRQRIDREIALTVNAIGSPPGSQTQGQHNNPPTRRTTGKRKMTAEQRAVYVAAGKKGAIARRRAQARKQKSLAATA